MLKKENQINKLTNDKYRIHINTLLLIHIKQ